MSKSDAFRLKKEKATKVVMRLIAVVNYLQAHFAQVGLCEADIECLA